MSNAATALFKIAEKIRSIIIPMQGTHYSGTWVVKVAMKYDKNTQQGGHQEIDCNNRITKTGARLPCKLIIWEKNEIFFPDDEWKSAGNNLKRGKMLPIIVLKNWEGWP